MLLGYLSVVRANYVCLFQALKINTYFVSTNETFLCLKTHDTLACRLFNNTVTVQNKWNSTEANDLNHSESFKLSVIAEF